MPRKATIDDQAARVKSAAHRIDPLNVYYLPDALRDLGLKESTVRRENKAGRLRIGRRVNRIYLLGDWVLEWLRGGEDVQHAAPGQPDPNQQPDLSSSS